MSKSGTGERATSRGQGWVRAGVIAAVLCVGLAGCNQSRSPMLQPVAPVPTVTATGNG